MRQPDFPLRFYTGAGLQVTAAAAGGALIVALASLALHGATGNAAEADAARQSSAAPSADTVELKVSQLGAIRVGPIGDHEFVYRKQAVGTIDFNQDLNVQVFTPYQGRIIQTYADLGDPVKKGQVLFTIESADFLAAESNLIGAAATLDQTASALQRATRLYAAHGIDQNDYESAVANQQTAEGALKAARNAVAIFGRTQSEIDRIVVKRQVEPALIVKSPISGRVTARSAAPGLLEQPGSAPAPYSVADLRTKWMVANVIESDSPLYRLGQPIRATVMAYPGRVFEGRISRLGRSLDPNTHRIVVRCELADLKDELIPGMLASFAIQVHDPLKALAIPVNGVVRNGDGSFAAWITTDRRRFTQRIVTLGEPLDGQYPVVAGLQRGELVVTDGAVFVSNILYAPPSD
ncbi:MAG TPA: efflux RND transporter periplasmic adaptor subunit [Steroidobacteraceae bacterium]|jgi:cobalt-zinc-cadmium efflux system membrane fusion protein|nr:efflux RND transporter periplasmic adaptor subunit [Steroidobacteraceae bacterium]